MFYISADRKVTAVPITLGSTVVAGSPQPLFTFPNPPLAADPGAGRAATPSVSARLGHSSVRTTADIYSHAIRGKDHAAAQCWDETMQRSRDEKSKGVN